VTATDEGTEVGTERRLRLRVPESDLPRFGLGHWYGVGSAVILVALAVAAILTGLAVVNTSHDRDLLLNQVQPAMSSTLQLQNAISAEDAAVRGYALTADGSNRTAFAAASAQAIAARTQASRLLRPVPHSGDARAALDQVGGALGTWRRDFAAAVFAKQGKTDLNGALASTGAQRLTSIRMALTQVQTRLTVLQTDGVRRLRSQNQRLYASLLSGALLLIIALVALAVLIRRTVLRPVSELTGQVRRVSQGDFAHPFEVTGPTEIAELSAHVDAMRNHIVEEWQDATQARAQLAEQADELRRSNAELEQFAYVASHDLQEPLRKVASFCQMLDRRYSDVLDERGKQYIDFAVDGAKRMQALINDLLNFSRVGRVNREMTTLKCEVVLQTALDNLGLARSEGDAGISWDPMPEVVGDQTLLTQVFQNLIGNAIKFRGEASPRIHIGVRRAGDDWEFACSDNGIGIEAAYAERVFLIFQRLHPKDEYTGTGIGLALCKKIVEYHGGRIWLDNEPRADQSTGTTIRWTLPAPAPVTDVPSAPTSQEPSDD
jgi:signal transduction histidine kinase